MSFAVILFMAVSITVIGAKHEWSRRKTVGIGWGAAFLVWMAHLATS